MPGWLPGSLWNLRQGHSPGQAEELLARDTRWTWWTRLCMYVVAQRSPDEDPIAPISPDPGADGGDLPAGFPQHWNSVSPSSCCPRGFSHPRHWVDPPAPALPPLCHQLPPKRYFNQQQQPGPCQVPGWELCPSGKRDGTRAGGL